MKNYDEEFLTEMTEAVENNNISFVRQQLESDRDLVHYNEGVGGWLDTAVDSGHREMAVMLIAIGCDVNEKCDLGTPLGTAISSDRPDMVQLLLDHGAKISSEEQHVLTCVTSGMNHSLEIVKILEQHGADFNEVFFNEQNGDNINALLMAGLFGHEDVEDHLRSKGCVLPEQPERPSFGKRVKRFFGKK